MQIKEILKLAAENLGKEDLFSTQPPVGADKEIACLLHAYKIVENELALDYFPLSYEEDLETEEGVIPYSAFRKTPVKIEKIEKLGKKVDFRIYAGHVKAEAEGSVRVRYFYAPKNKLVTDEWEVDPKVSDRLISFGVCCEYCLARGKFGEALTWQNKYKEAVRAAGSRFRGKVKTEARRWV